MPSDTQLKHTCLDPSSDCSWEARTLPPLEKHINFRSTTNLTRPIPPILPSAANGQMKPLPGHLTLLYVRGIAEPICNSRFQSEVSLNLTWFTSYIHKHQIRNVYTSSVNGLKDQLGGFSGSSNTPTSVVKLAFYIQNATFLGNQSHLMWKLPETWGQAVGLQSNPVSSTIYHNLVQYCRNSDDKQNLNSILHYNKFPWQWVSIVWWEALSGTWEGSLWWPDSATCDSSSTLACKAQSTWLA